MPWEYVLGVAQEGRVHGWVLRYGTSEADKVGSLCDALIKLEKNEEKKRQGKTTPSHFTTFTTTAHCLRHTGSASLKPIPAILLFILFLWWN